MKALDLETYFKSHNPRKMVRIACVIYAVVMTVLLLYGIPYDKSLFVYLVPLQYFGGYVVIGLLYVPFYLIFRAFGRKKITGPIGVVLSIVLELAICFCGGLIIPLGVVSVVYLVTGTCWILAGVVLLLAVFLFFKKEEANKKLLEESDIESVLRIRKQWMRTYFKWGALVLLCVLCLMGIGVYRHKYFTAVDCLALSLQLSVIIFQVVLSPYLNTYFSKYDKQYALFLRSFKIDSSTENDIISDISKGLRKKTLLRACRILRVGNPSLLMYSPDLFVDTFFLPSEDWQPIVRKYIDDAECIIVLINVINENCSNDSKPKFTQGVIWELYNNFSQRDKFVYCFANCSRHSAEEYLGALEDGMISHPLTRCVTRLLDEGENVAFEDDICAFTFDGEICRCYVDIATAVKSRMSSDENADECVCSFLVE